MRIARSWTSRRAPSWPCRMGPAAFNNLLASLVLAFPGPKRCPATVDTLLAGGSDPVITAQPEGAWTHEITDKALN